MTRRLLRSLPSNQIDLVREIRGVANLTQTELSRCGKGEYALSQSSVFRAEGGKPVSIRVLRDLKFACKEALRRTRCLSLEDRERMRRALDDLGRPTEAPNASAVRVEVDPPWSMPMKVVATRLNLQAFANSLPEYADSDWVDLQIDCWIHPHADIPSGYLSDEELLELNFRITRGRFTPESMELLTQFKSEINEWLTSTVLKQKGLGHEKSPIHLGLMLNKLTKDGIFISLGHGLTSRPEPSRLPKDPVFDGDKWLIAVAIAASPIEQLFVSAREQSSEVLRIW